MIEDQNKTVQCANIRPFPRPTRSNRNCRGYSTGLQCLVSLENNALSVGVQGNSTVSWEDKTMSITVGNHTAEGPYTNSNDLKNASGVYVILTRNGSTSKWTVIDIGESHDLRERVENHDRSNCWDSHSKGTVACAPIYTPHKQQAGRREIEQELRAQFTPACGKR